MDATLAEILWWCDAMALDLSAYREAEFTVWLHRCGCGDPVCPPDLEVEVTSLR